MTLERVRESLSMPESRHYKYLAPKRGSRYQQLAVGGRIRAEILYRETLGPEALTPEQVAAEYNLPLEAVREAIQYCEENKAVLDEDRAREEATIKARGLDQWPHAPWTAGGAMNLYLDDNSVKFSLDNLLRRAGHQTTRPATLGIAGASDPRHLTSCAIHSLVLLTRDHDDYLDLHDLVQAVHGRHCGILVVRADNDPARDMKDRDIVRAIANLEAARVPIENEFLILNHWR